MNGDFEGGLTALKGEDYEKARESFSAIIEQKPENADAHLGLSFAYAELGNIADAEKHLKAAFGLFEAQRKFSEAYVSAKELLEMKPKVVKYSFDLLRVYLKLDFMKSFSELLIATMENEEISEDALLENLSSLAHFIKDSEIKEVLILKKGGQKEEEKLNPFENLELANLLFEIGSTDEAKAEYYKTARAFLNRELKDKAQELLVKIRELYPDDTELDSLKAEIDDYGQQMEIPDLRTRKDQLSQIARRFTNENESRIRYSIAVLYKEYARYDRAKEELEILFKLPKTPEKIKAHVLLSQIFLDSKDNAAAIGVLKDVIASGEFASEELVPLEYKLGTLFEKNRQYGEAQEIFEHAYEVDSEYLDIIDRIKQIKELIEKQEEEAKKEEKKVEPEMVEEVPPEKEAKKKVTKEEKKEEEKKEEEKVEEVIIEEEKLTLTERILYI